MRSKIQLLDATLRDGGQGLEYLYSKGFSDKSFSEGSIKRITRIIGRSGAEIIEIGTIWPYSGEKSKFAIYQNVEELSQFLPAERDPKKFYVGLYVGPDEDLDKIPDWNPSLVKGIRVILRYSELRKSLDYCAALAKKGYTMFVQPMLTMRYSNDDLDLVLGMTNDMGAYACYFVDSFGYMVPKDIDRLFRYYDAKLNKGIKIGFHAHNNMNLAFSNVVSFLGTETDRDLIIDACAIGIGQGAGNLQTELIVPYLNRHFGKQYNYEAVLEVCDILDQEMNPSEIWGYSVTLLLPAVYKTAYKYALAMRNDYHLTFKQMNRLFRDMPDEIRHRYTPENLKRIMAEIQY